MLFTQARQRAEVLREQSVVLCGKKNPLRDTLLHCDTRSVPYLKGRTVADRFLKPSLKFPRHMIMGAGREGQLIFMVKRVSLPRESLTQRATALIKCTSPYFPGNFGITDNAN